MTMTHERTVTITELTYCSGVSPETVRELIDYELIEPLESAPEIRFPSDVVSRVHTILRLHMDLEVGYPAMGLVLDLLERIERLEARR
jgi:hypothetical protein